MIGLAAMPARAWLALAAVLAMAGALYLAYSRGVAVTELRWQTQQADQQALQAKALAAETTASRTEEQRRQAAADERDQDAKRETDLLAGRLATAESSAVGLRREIERLRNGRVATCDAIAAQQRQAAPFARVVLGGLLEEADAMAGSLAEALERSRIAGASCEGTYDAVRGSAR